jgi:hypothetical protein
MTNPLWLPLGRLSICLYSEGGPRLPAETPWRYVLKQAGKCLGLGVRLSLSEPALDLFVLWWMVSLTTREHAEWVQEQVHAYSEI